jgi:hypothetical protein
MSQRLSSGTVAAAATVGADELPILALPLNGLQRYCQQTLLLLCQINTHFRSIWIDTSLLLFLQAPKRSSTSGYEGENEGENSLFAAGARGNHVS